MNVYMYVCMYIIVVPYLLKQRPFGSLFYPQGLKEYPARYSNISLNA